MASIVDEYIENTMDNDDVFPCKGCGDILEEGKAFELAGNRWHLDCFRCNTCGTLLDSDANLLLLGDGSLICNNCTYSCTSCGNKIEDLAILTGDQAFCSTCFRCRNCKRKIENLRYARTSQGIFCMGCHETLMARRRKKSKAAAAAKAREKEHSPMVKEKSLPALPPNAIPNGAFSNDRVDPESDTPTELSPRPRPSHMHSDSSSRNNSRPARSPERQSESSRPEGLGLPANAYRKNRNSTMLSSDSGGNDGDSFFISVALDPSPGPTPRSTSDSQGDKKKDYFGAGAKSTPSEKRPESHTSTPHIAFQEKGRQHSSDVDVSQLKSSARKPSKSASQQEPMKPSPSIDDRSPKPGSGKLPSATDEFKLQEAPQTKKAMASRSSSSQSSVTANESAASKTSNGIQRKDGLSAHPPPDSRKASESIPPPRASQDSRKPEEDLRSSIDSTSKAPARLDNAKAITRKEVPSTTTRPPNGKPPGPPGRSSVSDDAAPPARQARSRPSISEQAGGPNSYMQPRSAPTPPAPQGHAAGKESVGSKDDQLEPKHSPKLPRWSSGGDFSLDEDMARIMGTDEQASSLLRRVSNAVRHGRTTSTDSGAPPSRASHARSVSETTRMTASPRWSKTPVPDHGEFASPSLAPAEDPAVLKRQLRNSEHRVAELERQFNSEKDLKSLNQKLIEKRKTVSVLDTQTEIMIRQLEVLAGYVERGKETKTPVNPHDLEDSAIKEFVQKLDKLKMAMSAGIEQLHEERDLLVEEKSQAMADRDRALMEFEQLSSKNAQLADMNNDLTHQIQERYKKELGGDGKSPNGLGIYSQNKSIGGSSVNLDSASLSTGPTLLADEEPIVEVGPTVVQVRKGQVKKFNWKKGGKSIAQNVSKGMNRAVVAFQNERQDGRMGGPGEGMSIGMPYNTTVAAVESPSTPSANGLQQNRHHHLANHHQTNAERQGFGFFGKKTNTFPKSASAQNVSTPDVAEPPSVLFGSDLTERAEFERRQIPNIVTRCIEEVELRGMDQEGIYRKTGGNSQVNMIKDGLDKSADYDISDPDVDITAVTSVLKQYFRKLPMPLLTFDVYERILESTAVADDTERCAHLRQTFASMPQSHQDCLEFLMFHLDRVAKRQGENLMSPKNLAVVFAPTIMRDLSIEREMSDMHAKNLAIQFVIEQSQTIFAEG